LQTLPQIEQTYEGKVRFVLRNFPVHGDPAVKLAEAALCANDQGKFWEYHDKLWESFQTSSEQAATGVDALVTALKGYASDLALDTAAFNDCLDSDKYLSQVTKDAQDAQSYGVTGTPAFFINGVQVIGAQPFSVFQQAIDAALEGGEPGSASPTAPSGGGG
jgi:protein-disulfide isomerase